MPVLHISTDERIENKDKAQAFLDAFFPQIDEPQEDLPIRASLELPWQPITKLKVQQSLDIAKGSTTPSKDGLPTLV